MNLVIVNENTIVVNALTIDIIKVLNGVYDVNSIEKELVNFYFNKVIIDITAIKNYFSSFDLFEFLNYFGKDKVILLLNDSDYCNSKEFLTQLINNGYYKRAVGETNYRTAAYAIQNGGYCCPKAGYANKIISAIEMYDLNEYDRFY